MVRIRSPKCPPEFNASRMDWDLSKGADPRFSAHWKQAHLGKIPREVFETTQPIHLEIGAGSGTFITDLAQKQPDNYYVAIERSLTRGKRLEKRVKRLGLGNVTGIRGNAIPTLMHGIPDACIDRMYHLYPCPWPKTSQRKHRWYVHPVMPHFVRVLKPNGTIVWTSDQQFYVEEAKHICESRYGMETVHFGMVSPNEYNYLALFPDGRSTFEKHFFAEGTPCWELVIKKVTNAH